MTTTKISTGHGSSKTLQDKTDWNKVYKQPQATADREAALDTENPVLKNARFTRLNEKPSK